MALTLAAIAVEVGSRRRMPMDFVSQKIPAAIAVTANLNRFHRIRGYRVVEAFIPQPTLWATCFHRVRGYKNLK